MASARMKNGTPPPVKPTYTKGGALDDLPGLHYAVEQFLASHMLESEEYCNRSDPKKERMYFTMGYGVIQCLKGLMSFEDEDLLAALQHIRHASQIANQHRKKAAFLPTQIAGYVPGALLGASGVSWVKSMTPVERHAELVYAECLFQNALVGIMYSGDWLAFIKEALNMRTAFNIYRQLGVYLDSADVAAPGGYDSSIDAHFRSGVYLGVGMSNIALSMMPHRLATLIELFGYRGDRQTGLKTLARAGGWAKGDDEPGVNAADEGLLRSICDMVLLVFHLFLSSFTFQGVDVQLAQKIVDWNLKRYPNGVFFLIGAGRLHLVRSQPQLSIEYYTRAMEVQSQYRNLYYISFWEMATAHLALWQVRESLECWRKLRAEASWSKCIYAYGVAVCLLESGNEKERTDAAEILAKVPDLRQKIAGKSIPLEKFAARKARKYQNRHQLVLPALELAYIFLGIAHAPRATVRNAMLPVVDAQLAKLRVLPANSSSNGTKENTNNTLKKEPGYWDDLALTRFLEGVCCRYIAFPDADAVLDPKEAKLPPAMDIALRAQAAFKDVFLLGPKIELEHHLVYHAHYELGRLLACQGDRVKAKEHFELVLSGKPLEVNAAARKGKYSMESELHMRTHAAIEALNAEI